MALAQAAAAQAGIPVKVSTDLTADLPQARALVYLSQSEGLGSGILLGMAFGVTVIASDTGGIPELIRHGENGVLVRNEVTAVAAALTSIDERLGRAARETVLRRFTTEHMVQATLEVYRGLC
jgi:glycosyltransferase involved in cell wall biosynthesis